MKFYEFFAGGGMVRLGLRNWTCLFANDIDKKKAATYSKAFGSDHLLVEDVAKLTASQLPGHADLAWASFPCQDLSLAGNGAGLRGERSSTFWPFWVLIRTLRSQRRAPKIVVLENVYGAITSNQGRDFAGIANALAAGGYRFGPLLIDAAHFLPQSRPRLFVVAVDRRILIPSDLTLPGPIPPWHPDSFGMAFDHCHVATRNNWIWWNLPAPFEAVPKLSELIEDEPTGTDWHTKLETQRLLRMMSPINLSKIDAARQSKSRKVGTLYRRTRKDENGSKQQRAEVRFDDVAGCLRTPAGGSSRQTVVIVQGGELKSRLLSSREAARLMGVPDWYPLPPNYNDAYHVFGDGVAVPVVTYLERNLFKPLLARARIAEAA
jgi:DNA (cytosine-5)-methyltransferase 1